MLKVKDCRLHQSFIIYTVQHKLFFRLDTHDRETPLTMKSFLHSMIMKVKHSWTAFCSISSLCSGTPGLLRGRLGLLPWLPSKLKRDGAKHTARLLAFIWKNMCEVRHSWNAFYSISSLCSSTPGLLWGRLGLLPWLPSKLKRDGAKHAATLLAFIWRKKMYIRVQKPFSFMLCWYCGKNIPCLKLCTIWWAKAFKTYEANCSLTDWAGCMW